MKPFAQASRLEKSAPAFGTTIRVELELSEAQFQEVASLGFATIAKLEKQFNHLDESSELSKLNCSRHHKWVTVSPELFRILQCAQKLKELSKSSFDAGNSLEFAASSDVKKLNCETIDLSVIAKGFCVDEAWASMEQGANARGAAVLYGRVFAGNDVFVREREPTEVALEVCPGKFHSHAMQEGALATSNVFSDERRCARMCKSRIPLRKMVTVQAKQVWIADALTKVALFHPKFCEYSCSMGCEISARKLSFACAFLLTRDSVSPYKIGVNRGSKPKPKDRSENATETTRAAECATQRAEEATPASACRT